MKERIREALAATERQPVVAKDLTPAAVLILLYEENGEYYMVFTKRTSRVEHHKGEISFPGGAWHEGVDRELWETSLRETEEEIGIPRHEVELLGEAWGTVTRRGYVVSTFVGFCKQTPVYKKSELEVDAIIEVPLSHLLAPGVMKEAAREWEGRPIPGPYYEYRDDVIWGATARMLRMFLEGVFSPQEQPTV